MKKFTQNNLKNIPLEDAHGGSGSRQVLVKPEQLSGEYFEAITKGYLNPGFSYDWHIHENIDEVFIVLKGKGKFYWEKDKVNYQEGDIFTIPANSNHKITAVTKSEFYFVRIKS